MDHPPFESMEELQQHLNRQMDQLNRRGIPEFENYSPTEMSAILNDPFGEGCPVQIAKMKDEQYAKVPILNMVEYLADLIREAGELKLTARGFLPVKVVKELYGQGFITEEYIESGTMKLRKEMDSLSVSVSRIMLEVNGITKKRNNKLSLTKKGEKLLSDNHELLYALLRNYGLKYNMGYFDGYESRGTAQLGFCYSLLLLKNYGKKKRKEEFYSDKYFRAFPHLMGDYPEREYSSVERRAHSCYRVRTFERFLDYFGFVKIEMARRWESPTYIRQTKLLNKMIRLRLPGWSE